MIYNGVKASLVPGTGTRRRSEESFLLSPYLACLISIPDRPAAAWTETRVFATSTTRETASTRPGEQRTYRSRVGSIRIILEDPRQAEVGHFADQVAVHEDVARCQVPVHIAQVSEVSHASTDASQYAHQLDDVELPVVFLETTQPRHYLGLLAGSPAGTESARRLGFCSHSCVREGELCPH